MGRDAVRNMSSATLLSGGKGGTCILANYVQQGYREGAKIKAEIDKNFLFSPYYLKTI
jgi:hypothetical protein